MNSLNIKELMGNHPKVKEILFSQTKENLKDLQREMIKGSIEKVEFPEIEDEIVESYLIAVAEQGIQLLIDTFDYYNVYIVPIYLFSDNWTCNIYSKDKVEHEGIEIFDLRTECVIDAFSIAFDILEKRLNDRDNESN